jgi:Ran GTPase-activating protein (RanGAP) involved in mRNA processing and transport
LKLPYHDLGNEGAAILGTALATNKTLKKLELRDLGLGNEGAAILGTALATNKTLKKLFLKKRGEWEVEGWRGFSDCLRSPLSALEELHIDNDLNGRTFQCMREVLMAFSHNRHLKMLELGGNTGVTCEEHFNVKSNNAFPILFATRPASKARTPQTIRFAMLRLDG